METTVKLQEGHSYSLIPIIVLAVLVIGYLIYLIIRAIVNYNKTKPKKQPVIIRPTENIFQIKSRYLGKLDNVKKDFELGNTSIRETYQLMSGVIRGFIDSATGINVSNYSLQDIRSLNLPILETLVSEYYAPEFARESKGDVMTSYYKTRKAIEQWN